MLIYNIYSISKLSINISIRRGFYYKELLLKSKEKSLSWLSTPTDKQFIFEFNEIKKINRYLFIKCWNKRFLIDGFNKNLRLQKIWKLVDCDSVVWKWLKKCKRF